MDKNRVISIEEVAKNKDGKSCWIVIHDIVYDITKFLEEHPGGEEVLLEQGGGFGTEAFEDVGHSTDARELMEQYQIGVLSEDEKEKKSVKSHPTSYSSTESGSNWSSWVIPLGLAVVAALLYRFVIAPTATS